MPQSFESFGGAEVLRGSGLNDVILVQAAFVRLIAANGVGASIALRHQDARIQLALRTLRQERTFTEAAKAAKVSPERLRKYAIERGLIEKAGRRWQLRQNLARRMLIFSNGKSSTITVADFQSASLVGRYMAAVGRFLETNDRSVLTPFVGQSVRDINGREYPFETRPNVLYRLSAAGEHTFEQIYRIVI